MSPSHAPLLSKLGLILTLVALAGCGSCSEDVAAVDEQDTAVRVEPPTPDAGGGHCSGCVDDEGDCQSGDSEEACGSGGSACAVCEGTETCSEDGCTEPAPCGPDNCQGCCTADGACEPGAALDACGMSGSACTTCGPGLTCDAGQCATAACGPANCTGCCDATGTCNGGIDDASCGAGGAFCSDCTAAGSTCGAGACTAAPSCASTCQGCCEGETCVTTTGPAQCGAAGGVCMACQADEVCSAGACVPVSDATSWDIIIISADIPPFKNGGAGWDPGGGLPDPFLEIYTEDSIYFWSEYSATITDSITPVWNERILQDVSAEAFAGGIEFWFRDDEFFADEICFDIVFEDPMAMVGQDIVTTCGSDPRTTYTWRIEPHL